MALGVGERLLLPVEIRHAVADGMSVNPHIRMPGQILELAVRRPGLLHVVVTGWLG